MMAAGAGRRGYGAEVAVTWDRLGVAGSMKGRDGHAMVAVPDGGALIFGGAIFGGQRSDETAEVIYIQPIGAPADDGTFGTRIETTGVAPAARVSAAACAVEIKGEPSMLVFGGMSMESGWLGDVHALGMSTLAWTRLDVSGELPSPRDKLGCAVVGTKVYLFGGFGPTDAPQEIEGEESQPGAANFTWFGDLYEIDTATLRSRRLNPTGEGPSARAAHSMCAVGSNVIICGGKDRAGRRNDVFIYDTVGNEWVEVKAEGAPAPETSFSACAPLSHGKIVLFGGRTKDNSHSAATSVLDLVAQSWLTVDVQGAAPVGRGNHSLCYSGGRVFLFGGSSDFNPETQGCQTVHADLHVLGMVDGGAKRKQGTDDEEPQASKLTRV